MKIGLRLASSGELAKPQNLVKFAERAEDLGFHALYMSDHIVIPPKIESDYPYNEAGFDEPMETLELITTLAYVAAITRKIELMTAVLVVPYRNPVLTAKMLANVDILSGGRLIVGLGVGWMEEEFRALNAPFENRGKLVDEYVKVFRELWSSDAPNFAGEFVEFENITLLPKPSQRRGPPIWIGGESLPAMRRAARLGDGWMPIGSNPRHTLRDPTELSSWLRVLGQEARKVGRSPSEVTTAYIVPRYALVEDGGSDDPGQPFVGDRAKILRSIKAFEAVGVSFLGFEILDASVDKTIDAMERFAEVVHEFLH
jgi:probable F420-dependent oxidoreductase